jgi:hypothetical protein
LLANLMSMSVDDGGSGSGVTEQNAVVDSNGSLPQKLI